MTELSRRSGVLLINLGTPASPSTGDVRRYLRQFLSDRRVIDTHPVLRKLLLETVILPTRPAKSARAYQQVWTPDGSPLLVHGRALTRALQAALGDRFRVELGMRYGKPSIGAGLDALRAAGVDELILFPLFPQYSAAASASALAECFERLGEGWDLGAVRAIGPFYEHEAFVGALAEIAEPRLASFGADHVMFSYHGLPERQIRKSDASGQHCLTGESCCDRIQDANRNCYRAQCFATTRALRARLGIEEARSSITFQSRLGRTPWIRPFTDHAFDELPQQGVKRLAVFCPSFVADCLETLEEIGIRGREQWSRAGGEELLLIPCPNSHPSWVLGVAQIVRDAASDA